MLKLVNKIKPTNQVSGFSLSNAIIPEFNPLLHNVDEWLNSIDEFAHMYQWDDKTTSHLGLIKLRGPAEVWYRGLPTKLFSWPEWKSMLLENFKPKRNLHKSLQEMMACVPKPGASLYEYLFEKLSLIHKLKIGLSDEDKVNLIMGGINDERIRFSVETANIRNPAVLASHFKTMEIRHDSGKQNLNKLSTSSTNENSQGQNKYCGNCRKRGHFRRECPKKIV